MKTLNKLTNSSGKKLYRKKKNIALANTERKETVFCTGLLKYNLSLTPFIKNNYQVVNQS